jgi:hypothetical protein
MQTETEIDRDRDPETQRHTELSNIPLSQTRTCRELNSVLLCTIINWFPATFVGCSGLLSLLVKL